VLTEDHAMRYAVLAVLALLACSAPPVAAQPAAPEATSLLGVALRPPDPLPNRASLERDLRDAQAVADPTTPDALIWIGRRQAYLWRYQDAIATFTRGIERYPDDPRFYRHRGHRFITTRQFDRAVADFEKAAALVAGRPDAIEPDGAPNPAGQPRSTLHFNIWYHLGLAHYLRGHFDKALDAYARCLAVSTNDDSIVAVSDWTWMTLMRLGRTAEAARVLERITPTMDLLENQSYHRRLLMYKGLDTPAALLDTATADATTVATQGYGVGHFHLVQGDTARARQVFEQVVAGPGWNAFGYIAAEAELVRLRAR
jgi:tetratricopeptide (TPR) repeat protein